MLLKRGGCRPLEERRRSRSASVAICFDPITATETSTMPTISRRALAAIIAVSTLLPGSAFAADALKEIRIDWATYNPVSMVLKQKGLLEKEFAKDGISVVWVQSAGSNKALEFLNAGSIDFGSTAGSAALVAKINGNPIKSIYVYSRPEWTALVTTKDSH